MTEPNTQAIYIPPNLIRMDEYAISQIRLGLQAAPGEGKTWAALTFPNPIVASFDKGLGAHVGRTDVHEVPFYNPDFVVLYAKHKVGEAVNRRDAFKKWLEKEAIKFTKEQTLVIDGTTGLETAFDVEERKYPVLTSSGEENKFVFWRNKLEYFNDVFESFKALDCHVVVLIHEQVERNTKGDLTGKVKTLISGQFADKIISHFTDHFRQHCSDKREAEKITPAILKLWGFKTNTEYMEMQKQFAGNSIYAWQVEGDDMFSAKASSLVNAPRFIPASYESFAKYRRQK